MATRLSKQLILHELNERADEVRRRFQVNQLGLFGSYVREQANAESDIDILIELEHHAPGVFDLKWALREFWSSISTFLACLITGLPWKVRWKYMSSWRLDELSK